MKREEFLPFVVEAIFPSLFCTSYPGLNNTAELASNVMGQMMSLWGRKEMPFNPLISPLERRKRGCVALYLSQFITL
jgi:hypothetical protein